MTGNILSLEDAPLPIVGVGIVLSGSDGALVARAEGLIIAQNLHSTEHTGMPQGAIKTGNSGY
jgi:chemotaxis response regulator CheB